MAITANCISLIDFLQLSLEENFVPPIIDLYSFYTRAYGLETKSTRGRYC
jgi:hypothetical protein